MKFSTVLGLSHLCLGAVIWAVTLSNPAESGMLPVVLVFVDFPLSSLLDAFLDPIISPNSTNIFLFILILVGSAWWYWIGSLFDRRQASQSHESRFP